MPKLPPRLSPSEQKSKVSNQFLRWFIATIKNSGGRIVLEKNIVDSVTGREQLAVFPDEKSGTVTIEVLDPIDQALTK